MRIGVDVMGGDNPPEVLFQGALMALASLPSYCELVIIATKSVSESLQKHQASLLTRSTGAVIRWLIADDFISMSEPPIQSVRTKKNSTLALGMKQLKKCRLDALVSSGNTGALIASSTLFLPRIKGVKRPALLALLPTKKLPIAILDVGGNVACKSSNLIQFADLGAAFQAACFEKTQPTIGLLNIGVESRKGHKEIQLAYEGLSSVSSSKFYQFIGNVEGREILEGLVDVIVTDGFTGNVLLKTVEGVAQFLIDSLSSATSQTEAGSHNLALNQLKKRFDYGEYPGAIICGVKRLVIKCHGNASSLAMQQAIIGASHFVTKKLCDKISSILD